jgi:hypothetical protein
VSTLFYEILQTYVYHFSSNFKLNNLGSALFLKFTISLTTGVLYWNLGCNIIKYEIQERE